MLRTCCYIISLSACVLISSDALAQKDKGKQPIKGNESAKGKEPVKAKNAKKPDPADTIKNKFVPHGLRIGTDLISIYKSHSGAKTFNGWEVNADMDFSRYYLAIDYGHWARNLTLNNPTYALDGNYQNSGHYFRIGSDVNFMLRDKDRNMFFMGFRYGHASFSEALQYTSTVTNFGGVGNALSNPHVTGSWGEITTGLKVKMWKGLWMGYTARFKFAPSTKGNGALQTFDLPGYGLAGKSTYWGFNYQIFWRFSWKKWAPIPEKKK